MSMQAPAGWYPDPESSAQVRWWDGAAWTAATQPTVQTQPAPPPSVQSTQPTPATRVPTSHPVTSGTYQPGTAPRSASHALLWVLLGLLVLGLVAGIVVLVSARTGGGAEGTVTSGSTASAAPSGTPSAAPSGTPSASSGVASGTSLAARAKQLGGTPFVAKDGSASMVVSDAWTLLEPAPDLGTIPGGMTLHHFWVLPTADATGNALCMLISGSVPGGGSDLDQSVANYVLGLKSAMQDFKEISREAVTTAYGKEARLVKGEAGAAGDRISMATYLVLDRGHLAVADVMTAPGLLDASLDQAMPFLATISAPAAP